MPQVPTAPDRLARTSEPKSPARKTARATPGGVSLSTCLTGMFLTLILGLYLGSLLPDLQEKISATQRSLPPGDAPAVTMEAAPQMPQQPTVVAAAPMPVQDVQPPASTPEIQKQGTEPSGQTIPADLLAHIAHLEKTLSDNPGNVEDWIELGNAYFDTNQPEQSIHAYNHALELAPDNPNVLTDLGIMYRASGNYRQALECFQKASAVNPRHVNSLFNEGVVLAMDLDRKDDGLAVWRRILAFKPDARAPNGKPLAELVREMEQGTPTSAN